MTDSSIVQEWHLGRNIPLNRSNFLRFYDPPTIGMVIGTFAAVPYIHLQLEARKRFYPTVPVLVHDDCSHKSDEIRELCEAYGVEFERNSVRQPACLGDMSAFIGGLLWAKAKSISLLVKLSRRWIFRLNWQTSLLALSVQSQYATFCSYTTTFGFGFRTECVGLAVDAWGGAIFLNDALRVVEEKTSPFVEGYMHNFARRFELENCARAEDWRHSHPMTDDRNGYALWTLMGTDRCERNPAFLWHDSASPRDYAELAREWGLSYEEIDFVDPNQGAGIGA